MAHGCGTAWMDMAKIVPAVVETTPTVTDEDSAGRHLFMIGARRRAAPWALTYDGCSRPAQAQILTPRPFMWVRIDTQPTR
jgi:hypothetical protein